MPLDDIRKNRVEKRDALKVGGVDPYPLYVKRTHAVADAHKDFEALANSEAEIVLAGRVMTTRPCLRRWRPSRSFLIMFGCS